MARKLRTGDIVLCKVGSFPPWPAVVFPQRLLRNDVYRKRKQNCVAVCFFNDPTYYWEQPHRLNLLDLDTIDDFLSQDSAEVSQPELVEAYQQARDYESLNEFIRNRFTEEGRYADLKRETNEGEIRSGEDPMVGKEKADARKRERHDESTDAQSSSTSGRNKRKVLANDQINKDKEPKIESVESDTKDNTPPEQKNGRSKRLHNGNSKNASMKEKRTKLDRARRVEISLLFRRRIQKNLIQRDDPPLESELEESHKMLNKIQQNLDNNPPFFDLEALRQSKLHKLFKVIVNDSNLEEFHPICKAALLHWDELVTKLKLEKLREKS